MHLHSYTRFCGYVSYHQIEALCHTLFKVQRHAFSLYQETLPDIHLLISDSIFFQEPFLSLYWSHIASLFSKSLLIRHSFSTLSLLICHRFLILSLCWSDLIQRDCSCFFRNMITCPQKPRINASISGIDRSRKRRGFLSLEEILRKT